MSAECNEKYNPNRVKREGVHQEQRPSPALEAGAVLVDEHRPAHWMVFARRYARFIQFYGLDDRSFGNWQPFFEKDPAATLAVAAVERLDYYKSNLQQYFQYLNNIENEGNDPELKKNFSYLFNVAGTLAWQLEQLKEALPPEIGLKGVLKNLVVSQLAVAFNQLTQYHTIATTNGLLNPVDDLEWAIMGSDIRLFEDVKNESFSADWSVAGTPTIGGFITALPPHQVFKEINYVATHNLFTGLFDQFLKVYARTTAEAQRSLEAALTKLDTHEPHYALFLTFLRLLEYARDHTNTLTQRHIDFYYQEVLRLKEKPAEPNHAHLLVELAKHVDTHRLHKGALLRGGKDSAGRDVFYTLDEDFVANKARVAAFKSFFQYRRHATLDLLPGQDDGRLYASPVANSADGLGAELTSADRQWHPLANKIYKGEKLERIDMPDAQVGFAVASPYLLLQQGVRTVTLTFAVDIASGPALPKERLKVEITGEKGWLALTPTSLTWANSTLAMTFVVDGDQPPIVPYSGKVHGPGLTVDQPVVKIWLVNAKGLDSTYQALKNLIVSAVTVKVIVSNYKNLSLNSDVGALDPAKPFQPFGSIPIAGASFIVGCNEIFKKKGLANPKLHITWHSLPNSSTHFKVAGTSFSILKKGGWTTEVDNNLFATPVALGILPDVSIPLPDQNEPYTTESKEGFFRFKLKDDFGHIAYQKALANFIGGVPKLQALRNKLNESATTLQHIKAIVNLAPDEPKPPFTPLILAISLSYEATTSISLTSGANFAKREGQFLHLHPFGYIEAHPHLTSDATVTLLPRFGRRKKGRLADDLCPDQPGQSTTNDADEVFEHEAEFYIGVQELLPPQNLSLLFQLAEGSANPKTTKPEDHVHWSYLRQNQWVAFSRDEVNDRTGQLMRSGIITFSLPRDASADNTLLPPGYHWLRAAIAQRLDEAGNLIPTTSDAVCKIIEILAQATLATFKNTANAADFLEARLPAGSITKLLVPEAEVKKVVQSHASFGGRPRETSRHFYTRVSERLRHKNRAVTVWDYERLILEAFPHIYKVKALHHTLFKPTETGIGKYNELAPGHVTVIAIPDLRNHNAIDPLHPYTSLGDLTAIAMFLRQHVSCFVNLHVHNPVFESVRVDFCVKFFPGTDEGFFLKFLKQEILRFLSPWAFGDVRAIDFGGKVYKSALINFVEEQSYVDYVTDFQLFHTVNAVEGKDREEVEASTAISILVSAPAEEHKIRIIPHVETAEAPEKCNC